MARLPRAGVGPDLSRAEGERCGTVPPLRPLVSFCFDRHAAATSLFSWMRCPHVVHRWCHLLRARENMRRMENDVVAGPMRVPQLHRRRSNLAALEATMEQIASVQQSQIAVQVRRTSRFHSCLLMGGRMTPDGAGAESW